MSGRVTNCVLCLRRPATIFMGHVRKGRKSLVAGICARCGKRSAWRNAETEHSYPSGFVGHWRDEMGEAGR